MTKNIYALFILLFLIWPMSAMLNSCQRQACDRPYCYYITGVTLSAVDNADSLPHEIRNGQVYAKALVLQMHLSDSTNSDTAAYNHCFSFSSPFISNSFAMMRKYDCAYNKDKHKFKSFRISSNKKFDGAHPADSSLLDLFYVKGPKTFSTAGDYTFYLTIDPDDTGTHVFTVKYLFDSATVFQASTPPIKLLK
jgi:hypothetical protein